MKEKEKKYYKVDSEPVSAIKKWIEEEKKRERVFPIRRK